MSGNPPLTNCTTRNAVWISNIGERQHKHAALNHRGRCEAGNAYVDELAFVGAKVGEQHVPCGLAGSLQHAGRIVGNDLGVSGNGLQVADRGFVGFDVKGDFRQPCGWRARAKFPHSSYGIRGSRAVIGMARRAMARIKRNDKIWRCSNDGSAKLFDQRIGATAQRGPVGGDFVCV